MKNLVISFSLLSVFATIAHGSPNVFQQPVVVLQPGQSSNLGSALFVCQGITVQQEEHTTATKTITTRINDMELSYCQRIAPQQMDVVGAAVQACAEKGLRMISFTRGALICVPEQAHYNASLTVIAICRP